MTRQIVASICTLALITIVGCASATERVSRGDGHFAAGRYSQALEQYESARQKDPALTGVDEKIREAQILVHLDAGDRALEAQRWSDAEAAYRRVGLLSSNHPDLPLRLEKLAAARAQYHFLRGQRFLADGNPFEAVLELEQAIAFQADHPRAATALKQAQTEKKDRRYQAKEAFALGEQARDAGDFDTAIDHFATTLELNPHHQHAERLLRDAHEQRSAAHIEAGDALMEAQEYQKARTQYQLALRGRDHLPEAEQRIRQAEFEMQAEVHAERADHAYQRNDWQTAYNEYTAAVNRSQRPQLYAEQQSRAALSLCTQLDQKAIAAYEQGDYLTAIAHYEQLLAVDPGFKDVAARCQRLTRGLPVAESSYRTACQAEESCDIVTAEKHFRRCADAIPTYRDAVSRLEATRERLNRAEDFFDRAIRAQNQARNGTAIVLFEECLTIAKPYRDVERRLKHLRAAEARRAAQENAPSEH